MSEDSTAREEKRDGRDVVEPENAEDVLLRDRFDRLVRRAITNSARIKFEVAALRSSQLARPSLAREKSRAQVRTHILFACLLKSLSNCVLPVQPTTALPHSLQVVTTRSTLLYLSLTRVVPFAG